MIAPMHKVTLLLRVQDREQALKELRKLGVVHVEPVNAPQSEDIDRLGAEMDRAEKALILLEEGKDSTAFCKKLLKEGGVSTTPGIAFGPTGQGHLRMSFCVPEKQINKAFEKMEAYFA